MTDIPSSLLIRFFQEAAWALSQYESDKCVCALSVHRKALLQVQLECLARVVAEYDNVVTVEQVQLALKDLGSQVDEEVRKAMDAMNDAARLAFCRLMLHDECRWDLTKTPPRQLNSGESSMTRQDLIEYAGLCNGVIRLANVEKHLQSGSPLFDDVNTTAAPVFPSKRLERIQQLLLRAVGYDIEFGKKEIERYFHGHKELDSELIQLLNTLSSNMTVALTNASMQTLSDQDEGGVTRVVSVTYSEKITSPDGHEISTSAPTSETIRQDDNTEEQLSRLRMARQAASLEQSILNDLMALSESELKDKLEVARKTHEDFVMQAVKIPAGQERIEFLTSVDPEKQQLLLIHKLWSKTSTESSGRAPEAMR